MSKLEAILLIVSHMAALSCGVWLAGWVDSQYPEQPTTEQNIGKQKIKGQNIRAFFKTVLSTFKKKKDD